MADKNIRDLSAASSLALTDLVVVDQGADAVNATLTQLKSSLGVAGKRDLLTDASIIFDREEFKRYDGSSTTLFRKQTSGSGSAVALVSGDTTRNGIVSATTGTTATGGAGLIGGQQLSDSGWTYIRRAGASYVEWRVMIKTPDQLSDATESYTIIVGSPDYNTTGVGAFLLYTHSVNGGKWQLNARQSALTTADSGVTVAAATWYDLRMTYNGTQIEFFLGGASVGTISTNIPNNFIGPGFLIQKSAGTTARIMYADYMHIYAEITR